MNDDESLLRALREMFTADAVPPEVVAAARDSYGWRSIDARLAELVADSLLASGSVRGGAERLLSYEVDDCAVAVEVTEHAGRVRVVGHLTPSQPTRVRAEQPGGTTDVVTDRFGRFTIEGLAPGPTRFVCAPLPDEAPTVHTEWTVL